MNLFHSILLQAKKERRRRRRDVNRKLKSWTDDAFVSGPEYFAKQTTNASKTTQKKEEEDTSNDEDRMWRRLLKHARSSSEAARLRRAWEKWRSTMEASETEFEKASSSGPFTGDNQNFSSNTTTTGSTNTRTQKNNGNNDFESNRNAGFGSRDWSSAWEEAFTCSYSNLNTDYETFWTYGSSDPRSQGSFFWRQQQQQQRQREEKQKEQAGNTHSYWSRQGTHTHSSHTPHSQRSYFVLNKEVRSNLSLLGLATTHLPTSLELKTAFRTSAMVHHPDKHQSDPTAASSAEEKFKQVQAAFAFLKTMVVV